MFLIIMKLVIFYKNSLTNGIDEMMPLLCYRTCVSIYILNEYFDLILFESFTFIV